MQRRQCHLLRIAALVSLVISAGRVAGFDIVQTNKEVTKSADLPVML